MSLSSSNLSSNDTMKTLTHDTNNSFKTPTKTKQQQNTNSVILMQDGSIKPFQQIPVSTKTSVCATNFTVDLIKLFHNTPITDYEPPVKRRGRRKRGSVEKPVAQVPFGSVVRIQHELNVRGIDLKEKKNKVQNAIDNELNPQPEKKSYFLHCVTVDIAVHDDQSTENKFKNVKIFRNGTLQITGCRNDVQYTNTVKAIFQLFHLIHEFTSEIVAQTKDDCYRTIFKTVMINRDFNLGFNILRNELDKFIINCTTFRTFFEGSVRSGLNIYIPNNELDQQYLCVEYNKQIKRTETKWVARKDYDHYFDKKNNNSNSENDIKDHTFLIFSTGHVIFSGNGPSMEKVFYEMINILIQNRNQFEEKLSSDSLQDTFEPINTTQQ